MNILHPELWKYVTNFLDTASIAILRHVCRDINIIITPKLITPDYIVSDAISLGFTSVAKFLVEVGYTINSFTVNSAVKYGNFEILNICIEKGYLTFYHFLLSIKSRNKSMITYISLPFITNLNRDKLQAIIEEIAKIDDVDIFKLLIPNRLRNSAVCDRLLVSYNSTNIIEYIRFSPIKRIKYEKTIIAWARHLNNVEMIEYCNKNDYGIRPV